MKRTLSILVVIMLCVFAAGCTQNDGEKAQFDFSYSVEKTKYARGETIQITATVTNVSGRTYRYVGCSGNDFIPFISLYNEIDGEKHYIECDPIVLPTDVVNKKVKNGESGSIVNTFVIPEDAKLGNYNLTLSLGEDKKEFTNILSIVELTAQNKTEKYRYSSTVVSSGNSNIQPIECFEGTTYYENGEPTTSGCGAGAYAVFDDPETKISDFPVLVCDGDITVTVPVNVTLGRIEVYDTSFQELEYTINDFSDLTALPYGEYLVVFSEQIDGRGCDAEIVDYWITDNENLFRLVIQEPSSKDPEESGYQAAVKLMRYNWDGWGVSTKVVATCDLAYSIIDALEDMTETGETVKKISNDVVDESATQLPIERGTLWIEAGSKIYRIDPDFTQLCRVDGHLGKGYVMNVSEQVKKMISDAWQYHPYDYYTGSYNNETDEIKINHVYDAPSTVHVHIKKVEVVNDHDPKNKISLELVSTVDQTISVSLFCSQSGDNLAEGDFKDITLKSGSAETIELSFGGWKDFNYWIDISIDNTKINLRIEP